MQIKYTGIAFAALTQLVNFIESLNTEGAGLRWLNKFEVFLQKKFTDTAKFSVCNNKTFRAAGLYCINYNDWVIAFSRHENGILIETILHSSRIVD